MYMIENEWSEKWETYCFFFFFFFYIEPLEKLFCLSAVSSPPDGNVGSTYTHCLKVEKGEFVVKHISWAF